MKTITHLKALLTTVFIIVNTAAAAVIPDDADLQEAQDPREWDDDNIDQFIPFNGERNDGFDWDLCRTLQRTEKGNMVVSPIGVKLLFTMLYEGAAGKSAEELETTLQLPRPRQQARLKYSSVLQSLQAGSTDYTLDLGTKMYIDNAVTPRAKFIKILKYIYNTDLERIDFMQPEIAAKKINTWVEGATNGRITSIINNPQEDLEMVKLMLVNAIFFKGAWKYPFPEELTRKGKFKINPKQQVTVNYMTHFGYLYYYYSPSLRAQIVRLPYMGDKFSMFILLPSSPTGITQLMDKINPSLVHEAMLNMTPADITVILPKFKFDYKTSMVEALQKLGLDDVFTENADLQGVLSKLQGNNLFVSNVVQKAAIEVNENGTIGAVVTQISTGNRFGEQLVVNVTHPFLFFIEDETTGTLLFVGKVVNPNDKIAPDDDGSKNVGLVPDTLASRFGELPTHAQFYPLNINWGWQYPVVPNQMPVATNIGKTDVIGEPISNIHPIFPVIPSRSQVYPAVIFYPVYIQGIHK